MIRWQLIDYTSNTILEDLDYLPTDWGPIFGLNGFIDKIHDLSWVGYHGLGWVKKELPDPVPTMAETIVEMNNRVNNILRESLEMVAADNTNVTKGERIDWMDYRRKVKEIPYQPGFPYEIDWPLPPSKQT